MYYTVIQSKFLYICHKSSYALDFNDEYFFYLNWFYVNNNINLILVHKPCCYRKLRLLYV